MLELVSLQTQLQLNSVTSRKLARLGKEPRLAMPPCHRIEIEMDFGADGMLLLEDEPSPPEQGMPVAAAASIHVVPTADNDKIQCMELESEEPQCEQRMPKAQCKKFGQKAPKKGAGKQPARSKPSKSLPPQRSPAEVDSELRQMVASKGKRMANQLWTPSVCVCVCVRACVNPSHMNVQAV